MPFLLSLMLFESIPLSLAAPALIQFSLAAPTLIQLSLAKPPRPILFSFTQQDLFFNSLKFSLFILLEEASFSLNFLLSLYFPPNLIF